MNATRFLLLSFAVLIFSSQVTFGQPAAWQPKRTWVFMAGLLEWKDAESFEPFPKEDRRDVILLDVLKKRGVPSEQIAYLQDGAATTAQIKAQFAALLGRTQPGDTLLVYYEGHGYKDDAGRAFLASYDVDQGKNPGWAFTSVVDAIEKYFHGTKAMVALDNCYSGTMGTVVRSGKRRVSYAVMASSSASQSSTANWTFTEALISAFRGDTVSDDNRDGIVTFAELEANAEADMLFGEEQIASFAFTGTFDPSEQVSVSAANAEPRVGERVEAYSVDDWYRGYITGAKDGKYLIHYYGYEESDDEWVTAKMIRTPKVASLYKIGEKVEVQWKRKWYPAHVLNVKGGSHYVSYDDYDTDDNEWVPSKRIRKIR